ncbi:MAG: hypothetical protein AAFP86_05765, partial [Planctomycetota bacterium]
MLSPSSLLLAGALALAGVPRTAQDAPTPRRRVALGAEVAIDLARAAPAPDGEGHVRVSETTPGMFLMEPVGDARVMNQRSLVRVSGDPSLGLWVAPSPSHRSFRGGKGILLSTDSGVGAAGFVALGDGSVWSVRVALEDDPRPRLVVERAGGAQRLLLPAPEDAPAAEVDPGGALGLFLAAPEHRPTELDALVGVRFEAEVPYASSAWVAVAEAPPGHARIEDARPFALVDGAPIVRLRARFTDADGRASAPGPSRDFVRNAADPAARAQRVIDATQALVHPEYQRRVEARGVLIALGDEALPRLEELDDADTDGPLALAVAEVLGAIDAAGGAGLSERRLVRSARAHAVRELPPSWIAPGPDGGASNERAVLERWLGPAPRMLLDADPLARAHGLLVALDRAQRGAPHRTGDGAVERTEETLARAETWGRALADIDPDPRVRALVRFALEVTDGPSRVAFDAPAAAWLLPEADRVRSEPLAPRTVDALPTSADVLRFRLEGRPELSDLDLGPALARVLAALGRAGRGAVWQDAVYDYDVGEVDPALRLIDRARGEDGDARRLYVDAASALFDDPGDELRALRSVSDRRLAEPLRGVVPERRSVRLEIPDLAALQSLLGELEDGPVDVLLPPGEYANPTDASLFLDLRTSGTRLLPADPARPVELAAGLRVFGARDVVLDGVSLRHEHGQALTVLGGGHVVVRDAGLASRMKIVHAQGSDVELVDVRVRTLVESGTYAVLVQLIGASRMHARATRFEGGTLYVGQGGAELVLDRCVVFSGERPIAQGQGDARLVARESLLVSAG